MNDWAIPSSITECGTNCLQLLLKIISTDFDYDFEDCSSVLLLFIWTCAIASQKHRPQSSNDISLHKCATNSIDAIVCCCGSFDFSRFLLLYSNCASVVGRLPLTLCRQSANYSPFSCGLVWRKRLALCCCYWMFTAKAICNRERTHLFSSLGLFFLMLAALFHFGIK